MSGKDSGNNEREYYTPGNVFLAKSENQGNYVTLRGLAKEHEGYHYTSGKIHSKNQYGPYGFFNVKAEVPKGNGLWPAIWLLPIPTGQRYGGWAASGEIDIMETIYTQNLGFSTIHYGGVPPKNVQYPKDNWYPFHVDWSQPCLLYTSDAADE